MKKSFIFGFIAAALGFTACSSEDDAILSDNTQKKGMVLNATVEQSAETRATIDNTGANATNWKFAFATDDVVEVTNSAITDTYYTFTKGDTNFASADATPTASATSWYAYFPSKDFPLTGQEGTLDYVANHYALAGATTSDVTGETGLSIAMKPQVAIIKITNNKGAIDIRVKENKENNDNKYVVGLKAANRAAGFDVVTNPTTSFTFLQTSTAGPHYIVVPAGVPLTILDYKLVCKTELKSTDGLQAGKYYELTINPVTNPDQTTPTEDTHDPYDDSNLLPGLFSVSASKKVQFTKGNLYWDGREFKFEDKQTYYPSLSSWNTSHIGHFFWTIWTEDQAAAYADSYNNSSNGTDAVPFFAESNKNNLTVEGTTGLYALSQAEWDYLLNSRPNAEDLCKVNVNVGGTTCFVIAPDGFSGELKSSYTVEERDANTSGLLFLPVAGQFDNSKNPYRGMGYYWTSTPDGSNDAWVLKFDDASASSLVIMSWKRGDERYCLRLVK